MNLIKITGAVVIVTTLIIASMFPTDSEVAQSITPICSAPTSDGQRIPVYLDQLHFDKEKECWYVLADSGYKHYLGYDSVHVVD